MSQSFNTLPPITIEDIPPEFTYSDIPGIDIRALQLNIIMKQSYTLHQYLNSQAVIRIAKSIVCKEDNR